MNAVAYSGKRVLVTGGCGFIGSHLVEALSEAGAHVTVVDALTTGREENLAAVRPSIRLVLMPLIQALRDGAVRVDDHDFVFHVAANAYIPPSVENPAMDFEQNLMTSFQLLEATRKAAARPRLVLFSTGAIYGNPVRLPMREEDPTVPISPYGVSKLASERYVDVYAKLYGLQAVSLRLFSAYGPRQRKQVVYDLIRKCCANAATVEVLGDGTQERDLVFVRDVVQAACVAGMNAPANGETYNVASGTAHTIAAVVREVCRVCGVRPEIRYTGQTRPGDADKWSVDVRRLKALGYAPQYTLAEGLALVRDWCRTNL